MASLPRYEAGISFNDEKGSFYAKKRVSPCWLTPIDHLDKIKAFLAGFTSERESLADRVADMNIDENDYHGRWRPKYMEQLVKLRFSGEGQTLIWSLATCRESRTANAFN